MRLTLENLKEPVKQTPIPLALLMVLVMTLAYGAVLVTLRLP